MKALFLCSKYLEGRSIFMAGRKSKPTALKKLEGNPGKRELNTKEPVPGKGMPDCPKWLLPESKEETIITQPVTATLIIPAMPPISAAE